MHVVAGAAAAAGEYFTATTARKTRKKQRTNFVRALSARIVLGTNATSRRSGGGRGGVVVVSGMACRLRSEPIRVAECLPHAGTNLRLSASGVTQQARNDLAVDVVHAPPYLLTVIAGGHRSVTPLTYDLGHSIVKLSDKDTTRHSDRTLSERCADHTRCADRWKWGDRRCYRLPRCPGGSEHFGLGPTWLRCATNGVMGECGRA